jgi:hypothetical protein
LGKSSARENVKKTQKLVIGKKLRKTKSVYPRYWDDSQDAESDQGAQSKENSLSQNAILEYQANFV